MLHDTETKTLAYFTLQEVVQRSGLSEHTLRYYERIGLLDRVKRDRSSGHRRYTAVDVQNIETLACLRTTGMSIEDMRTYFALLKDGRAAADQQLASGTKGVTHFVAAVVYFFAGISVEKGAQTTLYLATSPQVEGVSGKYFVNKQEKKSTRNSYDQALGQRLWMVSEQLVACSVQVSDMTQSKA